MTRKAVYEVIMHWWQDPNAHEIELPIFPLPNTVQFPGTLLPLHIFEPRYRAMIADALQGAESIGIALLKPGYEASYYARPAIYTMACAGRIVSHEKQPDGRYHILLQGLRRIELLEEREHTPYRMFRARLLRPPSLVETEKAQLSGDVQTLLSCVRRVLQDVPDSASATAELLQLVDDPGLLSDVTASVFVNDPERRQELLEESDIKKRLSMMIAQVGEVILQLEKQNRKKRSDLN